MAASATPSGVGGRHDRERRADARGDDDDRGRARGASDGQVCSSASARRTPRRTSPAACTRPTRCSSTSPARSSAKPRRLPLSIGDDDLAETAAELVSVPEMFNYWVGAGRIDVGFLGAAQIDRHANINTTVIGAYEHPKVRLPGAGGAPEIAAASREVIILLRQSKRSVRREARLHHVDRLRLRARRARAARVHRRGPDGRHHRPRRSCARARTTASSSSSRCIPGSRSTRSARRPGGRCASASRSRRTAPPTRARARDAARDARGGARRGLTPQPGAGASDYRGSTCPGGASPTRASSARRRSRSSRSPSR